jgi:hypothetical protein
MRDIFVFWGDFWMNGVWCNVCSSLGPETLHPGQFYRTFFKAEGARALSASPFRVSSVFYKLYNIVSVLICMPGMPSFVHVIYGYVQHPKQQTPLDPSILFDLDSSPSSIKRSTVILEPPLS